MPVWRRERAAGNEKRRDGPGGGRSPPRRMSILRTRYAKSTNRRSSAADPSAARSDGVRSGQFSVVMHPGFEAELAQPRPAADMPTQQTHRAPANHSLPCRPNCSPDGWRRARETHRESRIVDSAGCTRGDGQRVNCDGHAQCPTMHVSEHMDVVRSERQGADGVRGTSRERGRVRRSAEGDVRRCQVRRAEEAPKTASPGWAS